MVHPGRILTKPMFDTKCTNSTQEGTRHNVQVKQRLMDNTIYTGEDTTCGLDFTREVDCKNLHLECVYVDIIPSHPSSCFRLPKNYRPTRHLPQLSPLSILQDLVLLRLRRRQPLPVLGRTPQECPRRGTTKAVGTVILSTHNYSSILYSGKHLRRLAINQQQYL